LKRIILASASPRRKELLEKLGIKFKAIPGDYAEHIIPGLEPHELVRRISLEKGKSVAGRYKDALIIAADTLGFIGGEIIGKPESEADACRMLEKLSEKWNSVITGFSIIDTATDKTISRSVETRVLMKNLTPAVINDYVKTGEPLDKAGGYAIQGLGSALVERIEGDYYNVVGLPLKAVADALLGFGIKVSSEPAYIDILPR
jgi:septum formation protein